MKHYRIEVKLNKEQEQIFNLNVSACRIVYNLYVDHINNALNKGTTVLSAYNFSKWFNNEYIPNNPDKAWLKQVSSKSIQQTMNNCYRGFQKCCQKRAKLPKYKKKDKKSYYFVRADKRYFTKHFRNKIYIPRMKWVTFKEMNYLPIDSVIIKGVITKIGDRFFVSLLTEDNSTRDNKNQNEGIGIDLGLKEFMTCSNGLVFDNINKTKQIKRLEKLISRTQRALDRKYTFHKKNPEFTWNNFDKNKIKLQKQYYKLQCIRHSYINKCIDRIIEEHPRYITLEKLELLHLLKNKNIAKTVSSCQFYYTKQKIIEKATKHNIEVREVSRFYPSSKTCCKCGNIKKDLKLSERIYKCSNCNNEIDRDLNASINLKNAKEYKVLNEVQNTDGLSGINAYGLCKNLLVPLRESTQDEVRKSQFVLKDCIDIKRGLCYKQFMCTS